MIMFHRLSLIFLIFVLRITLILGSLLNYPNPRYLYYPLIIIFSQYRQNHILIRIPQYQY
ncbi:unnamed protein product [Meloidogyne enterolobii]|uniref:Uncharacterized protein n=1 Tax=Meloidogyne enterolobii TaxID=390850 RepID=A0ACB0XWJ6_MELEN